MPSVFEKEKIMSQNTHNLFRKLVLPMLFILLEGLAALGFQQKEQEEQKKENQKITEEILVVAEAPKDLPVSTVTRLDSTQIEQVKPLDLSEIIRYAPGVSVTFGNKAVYSLKLRGMDEKRIVLLIDGIPVYEPYYSSFDLKTIAAEGIQSLQLTKGPSSVLYGPNTLGGIVNVITRRPSGKPELSFNATYGENNTRSLGIQSAYQYRRLAFTGSFLYQDSDGFKYPNESGGNSLKRTNSEYQRTNINAKVYHHPNDQTEFLFNAGIYRSNYSMPPGLLDSQPRYWRFKNWDRYSFNAGGFAALGKNSTLRFRSYYVKYDNTLNMFNDAAMTQQRFESTFDNAVYGLFGLTDLYLNPDNQLKVSVTYKGDEARLQDDIGEPWNVYDQATLSVGIEEHFTFFQDWKLVGGLSYDYLDKFLGKNTSKINPLLGVKYTPGDYLDIHVSFSKKSKFPSMRAMYSGSSGNPDLLSESGINWELGFTYNRELLITGSAFLTRFKDMIDSVRLPQFDFQRRYFNIAKAFINGWEMQVQKSFSFFTATINYTYLDHRNESDNRPLDALPHHNLNFDCQIFPVKNLRLGIMGLAASASSWYDFNTGILLDVPGYLNMDLVASYRLDRYEVFLKMTNLWNHFTYTEPGYPWRGRYLEAGLRADIL